ncbi:class II glutamine amidotransferase [Ekhidna sp.]|uniref:class II glutamine amidotransferase n=1 Tax=Ekhidna sp. TaxID=2608089 RepID=UPI0035133981
MCRFTFYQGKPIRIGSLITEPKHSLIHQSMMAKEREEPLNGDGFGLAWYSKDLEEEPALFKSVSPAWSNQNLHELSRVIETTCVMAHVRAATQGFNVSESNCHPFKWKQFAFMHNGDIGGFRKIKRPLIHQLSEEAFQHIKGSTDSEHFFAILIDELIRLQHLEHWDRLPTAMMSAIKKVIALIHEHGGDEHSYMNMVLTDGHLAVAVRFTTDPDYADSLYLNLGKKYVCENGVCFMMDPGYHEKSVVISSEPLSKDPGWEKVAVNSMVLVEEGKIRDKMEIHLGTSG